MNEEMKKEEEEEEEDVCTCGQFLDAPSSPDASSTSSVVNSHNHNHKLPGKPPSGAIDASFVHLPTHFYPPPGEEGSSPTTGNPSHPHRHSKHRFPLSFSLATTTSSFLEQGWHVEELNRAAQSGGDGAALCAECLCRVARALDADSERLVNECYLYDQAARQEEERYESLHKALQRSNHAGAEQAFQTEIQALREECQQQEAELMHLKTLQKEQVQLAQDLQETEYELEVERNALELESRAFNNDQEQLYQWLHDIDAEVDQLSSSISLPSLLLNLQVDERGLRYPLINELRLAYRPKGDLKFNEIQVAWSLAAQLLLVVGTLFKYPSEQWKIVPLSHCAKLIFYSNSSSNNNNNSNSNEERSSGSRTTTEPQGQKRAVVYHLGHPRTNGAKAIRAWNTLLHQVILHVQQCQQEDNKSDDKLPELPFPITATTVGTMDLTQLDENDDAGWSKAIHFMASDLLWLSECAAVYTSQQVLWTSAVLEAFQA